MGTVRSLRLVVAVDVPKEGEALVVGVFGDASEPKQAALDADQFWEEWGNCGEDLLWGRRDRPAPGEYRVVGVLVTTTTPDADGDDETEVSFEVEKREEVSE